MLAGAVDQRIEVDPADTGGIRPQLWPGTGRQGGGHLGQVLQHPRACPIGVRVLIENHIDEGVTEKGIAHLRRLPRIAGFDDHLDVGQVRNGIHRRVFQREEATCNQYQGGQHYKEAIADRPADNGLNHGRSPHGRGWGAQ